ncbi:unnamed protein product [Ilex paraguariensis]|uniref:Magnesium transporter n=1 Tax=Ilex paraguariensis TaxID=185542 RepID=A0ABC8R8E9_9AQUA
MPKPVLYWQEVLLNGWLRIYRHQRRELELMQSEVVEEIIYGLESGILFGMASVLSKMGFLFLEQGFSKLLVPICISTSVCCSASGFVYQTRGLKHGRAIVVSTCAAVASIVTGVLAGMLALGERLPSAPMARLSLLLGCTSLGYVVCEGHEGLSLRFYYFMTLIQIKASNCRLFIIIGVILLVSSTRVVRYLPRPWRHLFQSAVEKNFSLRQSASLRTKDPSPSAVIQTSTLHHLISSPTKESLN